MVPTPPVEIVPAPPAPLPPKGCQFAYDDGRMCLSLKLKARNLCDRHYKQLSRLGAFQHSRIARTEEALANISTDRLAKARDILERAAPMAAKHLKLASQVAASRGDAKPALALLLHTGALAPLVKEQAPPPTAPVINIGFALSGLSSIAKTDGLG